MRRLTLLRWTNNFHQYLHKRTYLLYAWLRSISLWQYDITVEGVANVLTNLQGQRHMDLTKSLLKETAVNIAPILTLVFKASLHHCRLPQDWKSAHVFPIFKKGSCNCPHNYRPISLTSIPYKVFEHVIYSLIYKHLDKNSILCDVRMVSGKTIPVRHNLLLPSLK